jgi:tetratricopeptide (TPR) repeat protein
LATVNNHALGLEHVARAYELERLERHELALQEVQRALVLVPGSAEAHTCGAWILRQSGRLEDAEEAIHRALRFDPTLPAARNVQACILWSQGRVLEAEQAFQSAIALQGSSGLDTTLYIANYARMQLARQRAEEALKLTDRALALSPSHSSVHEVRGEVLRVLGMADEALAALHAALRIDPRNARAHNSLGQVQLSRGQVREAQDSFREALRLQPGETKVQANLVSALRAQYPLYGRLLAFAMRTNTVRGRVYFLWVSVIAFGLVLFLPIVLSLVYGFQSSMTEDAWNLWMLVAFSVFAVWLLAIAASPILRPLFNLLLSLDARNRTVVELDPADVVGVGLLVASVLSLLTFGILLATNGPFEQGTLLALYLGVAGLSALLLSAGLRRGGRGGHGGLDEITRSQWWMTLARWVSYGVLTFCLYALAAASAFDISSSMSINWLMPVLVISFCAYGALWVTRALDARRVPASARRALMQWLLGVAGIAAVGFLGATSFGLDTYGAVLVATLVTCVSVLATTHRSVRNTRLYTRWVRAHGEVSARNRATLYFMCACACLAAIALVLRFLPAG